MNTDKIVDFEQQLGDLIADHDLYFSFAWDLYWTLRKRGLPAWLAETQLWQDLEDEISRVRAEQPDLPVTTSFG